MSIYVEADTRVRTVVIGVTVALILLGMALKLYAYSLPPVSGSPAAVLQSVVSSALATAVFFTAVFAIWSVAVLWLVSRTIRSNQWPPLGMRMPYRSKVYTAPSHATVWFIAGLLLVGQAVVAVLAWRYFLVIQDLAGAVV